jgi:hypothetical protein
MKRGLHTSVLFTWPDVWHANEQAGTWEYGNYRHCYLFVLRLENGKYKALIGSGENIPYGNKTLPECGYFAYDTLEEAKAHCTEYVDWVRDVYDVQEKLALQARLHRMNPKVYLS